MQSSMLQKKTMPDSSCKLIGIPISLWQLERDSVSPTSLREASLIPCQAWRIPRYLLQLERSPDVEEQTRVLKVHPHGNSRIYLRFLTQLEENNENFPSNLVFPQQRKDFCLVVRDTSEFSSRLGRAIGTPL